MEFINKPSQTGIKHTSVPSKNLELLNAEVVAELLVITHCCGIKCSPISAHVWVGMCLRRYTMSSPSLREIRWSKGLVLGHFVSKNVCF